MAGIEAFAETRRLIIVAAHADDMETMCGGTVARLAEQGVMVFLVNCTLGDLGTSDPTIGRLPLALTRQMETREAAQILGLEQTFQLDYHDGELVPSLELRAELARLYRLTGADTLWTFDPDWPGQIHPDHRAAGRAALDAYMPSKMPLYHPEQLGEVGAELGKVERVFLFATERDPDIYVDVTGVYAQKLAACLAHISQFPRGEESLEWMMEIDRADGEVIGVPYAESFRSVRVW